MKLLTIVKMNSVWPQTVNFVSPVRVGDIRLEPVVHGEQRPIRMQLQIKGKYSPDDKDAMVCGCFFGPGDKTVVCSCILMIRIWAYHTSVIISSLIWGRSNMQKTCDTISIATCTVNFCTRLI